MKLKKVFNIFILFVLLCNITCCYASNEYEKKQKELQAKIKRSRYLEGLETNKLYKNQQKLENATTNLQNSKTQIITVQRELDGMQAKLTLASADYNKLNSELAVDIRKVYKSQRKAFFELLLESEDINMLVDRLYFQKIILQKDLNKMLAAKQRAQEIAMLKYDIESKKRNLERSVASINSQQIYIKNAIAKNESMINKLRTDRAAYQRAEREMEDQSRSIGKYISHTKTSTNAVASGFSKPIQGRITSPFGYRTHPIFNTK